MKIHDTKKDALAAIKRFAEVMRKASKETGADFVAEADDDSGMGYYVNAAYRNPDKKIHEVRSVRKGRLLEGYRDAYKEILEVRVHFQELDLQQR